MGLPGRQRRHRSSQAAAQFADLDYDTAARLCERKELWPATAANPTTPPEVLSWLAHHHAAIRHIDTAMALISNLNTPTEAINNMAWEGSPLVRIWCTESERVSTEALKELCADPDAEVRRTAQEQLTERAETQDSPQLRPWARLADLYVNNPFGLAKTVDELLSE